MKACAAGLIAISVTMLMVVLALVASSAKTRQASTAASCKLVATSLAERAASELEQASNLTLDAAKRFAAAHRAIALGSAAAEAGRSESKDTVKEAGVLLTKWNV